MTRPASYCGVAGFVVPAGGSLDTTGFVGLAPGLDAVGLLTPTVADLRLAHGALTGADRLPGPPQRPTRPRLAVWSGDELAEISKDMRAALVRSVEDAVANGAVLVDVDWPALTPRLVEAHVTVMAYEAARTLAEESTHPDRLSAPLNELLAHGRSLTTGDYEHARSLARRERSAMPALLCDVDAVLGPAVTVPGHPDAQGMPLGLQLVGHPHRLEDLFSLGHAVERAARANG
ncbi:amidase family protein [Streptomyces olivochromogenes]|uniref:amidase family protein n=1 Tax=Streptomyces olivochromogenes TaxID=1963 RepID=UPI0036DA8B6A